MATPQQLLESIANNSTKTASEVANLLDLQNNDTLSATEKSETSSIAVSKAKEQVEAKHYYDDVLTIEGLKVINTIQQTISSVNNGVKAPIIVHFSDVHKDVEMLEDVLAYSEKVNADMVIFTGDYVRGVGTEDISDMLAVQNKHKRIPYIFCLGNHEQNGVSSNVTMRSKFMNNFASWNNYIFPSTANDVNYYHMDFSEFKLRIICMHQNAIALNHRFGYTQAQINWFITLLGNTPEDYGIFVLRHTPEFLPERIEGKTDFYLTDPKEDLIYGPTLDRIVDAFVSRTTLSGTLMDCNSSNPQVAVNANFTNVPNSVEFLGFMSGHYHTDLIGYAKNANNHLLELNVPNCAAHKNEPYWERYNDVPRTYNTDVRRLFNVYTVDREKKMIRIVRCGSNLTYDLRERKYMSVSYV